MSDIRAKFPMYGDVSDDQLLISLHKKHYADIPAAQFFGNVERDTERERLGKETTDSMSWGEKAAAGFGKAAVDIGRTGKRVASAFGVGDYDQAAAAEDQRLDAPLMATGAGKAGHFAGDVAMTAIPGFRAAQLATKGATKALPKALAAVAPYVGAVGSGAAVGAATSPADLSGGATTGAVAGGAGEVVGRVGSAVYQGAKAAVEPLWEAGRERVVKRLIERFADDPAALAAKVAKAPQHVPGVVPTLAEATGDTGIAHLQRSSAAASPDVASALQGARDRQLTGYRSVLDDLSGSDGKREFFTAARDANAAKAYAAANAAGLDPAFSDVAAELMKRPAIRDAVKTAQRNARNMGTGMDNAIGSVAGMQQVKSALDDKISVAVRAGDKNAAKALQQAKDDLLAYLDKASVGHGVARRQFQADSRPINQMEVAQRLRDTALPALTDTQGVPSRVNANAFAKALRDADQTAKQATGFSGAKMADIMEPQQMQALHGIERDMGRYASAGEAGAIPGSRTAQHIGAANVIGQIAGPLGMSRSAADSAAGRIASGLLGLPFRLTQSQTEQLLARAFTDPAVAQRVLNAKDSKTIVEALRPYAAQFTTQSATAGQ